MRESLGQHLRRLRKARGESQQDVAAMIGAKQSTVSRWERDEQEPEPAHLARLAAWAKEDVAEWLNRYVGEFPVHDYGDFLPVVGAVEADYWAAGWEWPETDKFDVAVPADRRFPDIERFGLLVRGPAMDKLYPDGAIAICANLTDLGTPPAPGQKFVVLRRDPADRYEVTIKELAYDQDGTPWLWPRSNHPAHQTPLPYPGTPALADTASGRPSFDTTPRTQKPTPETAPPAEDGPVRIAARVLAVYKEE